MTRIRSLSCSECRHERDENLPKSACKICENLNAFSPKEVLEKAPICHECTGECNGNCDCEDFNETEAPM